MKITAIALSTAATLLAQTTLALAGASNVVLTHIAGKALVNSGEGFVPLKGAVTVKSGTQVFVSVSAAVSAHFKSCDVDLVPGTVTRLVESELCNQAAPVSPLALRGTEDAVVITPANGLPGAPGMGFSMLSPGVIGGGFVLTGLGAVAVMSVVQSDKSSSVPVSGP